MALTNAERQKAWRDKRNALAKLAKQHQMRTEPRELAGDAEADAGGAAGDHAAFVCERFVRKHARTLSRIIAVVRRFAVLLLMFAGCGPPREPIRYPNAPVILISVDTLRSDHLPAYGYRGVQTPNLDALRADSILYERAYSQCPMTLPSHVTILTGLLPTEHGVRNNIGYRFDGSRFPTVQKTLREHGYRTGAAVSSYVLRSETGISDGFDFYDDAIPAAATGPISEYRRPGFETLRVAKRWISDNAQRPFFFFYISLRLLKSLV
jgi:hypothetical protein